jgi:hypothetical protein
MVPCSSYNEKATAPFFKQDQQQRMITDPRSTFESNSYKPMWWFMLNRTGQAAAMRKIAALYRTAPGLAWEEKWAAAEAVLRGSRKEQMAGIDQAILHIRRSLVYDGDSQLPALFAGCVTEDDRLNALLARPSRYAQMALDTFSRRTVSDRSVASSPCTQAAASDVETRDKRDGEKFETATATRSAGLKDENPDGYESGDTDELDEEDAIWEGLVKSCGLSHGTF